MGNDLRILFLLVASIFIHSVFGMFELNSEEEDEPTTCRCGISNQDRRRIIGGSSTSPHEYPFMLLLVVKADYKPVCGAVILSERHALTGAHCTHGQRQPLAVLAGLYDQTNRDSSVQESEVRSVEHVNYFYTEDRLLNDIALLVLATPLKFNNNVMPVCIPVERLNIASKKVKVIGWGKTSESDDGSPKLLQTDLEGMSSEQCAELAEKHGFVVLDTMHFCAQNSASSACTGDSGGPAVWLDPSINRYTLVGLVSFSPPGCTKGNPVVLTDIYTYTPWIYLKTREHMCRKL